MSDPLPQALILTAIVITFGISAFLLAMIYRSWRLARNEVVGDDEEDRRVAGRSRHRRRRARPRRARAGGPPAGHADSLSAPTPDADAGADRARPTTSTSRCRGGAAVISRPDPAAGPAAAARRRGCALLGRPAPAAQRTLSIARARPPCSRSSVVAARCRPTPTAPPRSSVGGWPAPLGIVLVVDRLSALMLVVSVDRRPRRARLRRRPGRRRTATRRRRCRSSTRRSWC